MRQGQGIILKFANSDKFELNLQIFTPRSFSQLSKHDGHRSGPFVEIHLFYGPSDASSALAHLV
jgi:hypothetical protein